MELWKHRTNELLEIYLNRATRKTNYNRTDDHWSERVRHYGQHKVRNLKIVAPTRTDQRSKNNDAILHTIAKCSHSKRAPDSYRNPIAIGSTQLK